MLTMTSKLWGTSVKGNVYVLPTNCSEWSQIQNQRNNLQGFKKVVGCSNGAWGLGCDHQIYVYVEGSDVPIRIQESTNENERWIPTQGWSKKHLLPLDPWGWSSENGLVHMAKEDIKSPSASWDWESDWKVDENINGYLTDKEGWRYSDLDFNRSFSHKKSFRSCVRRRRWIRYRRYIAFNKWAKLASLHVDPLCDPIVDVTIGGQDMPNQQAGAIGVWIATIDGKLIYRSGVCQQCPEGVSFADISMMEDHDVISVSAGRRNCLWVLTWHGAILARNGITWQNPKGTDWSLIPFPEGLGGKDKLVQAAVGIQSAWVVSAEGKVWLRKGMTADCVHGTGWLQMVNTMKAVTIGGQDKVFGIDQEDRQLYFRSGISNEEQSGKSWQVIDLPFTVLPVPKPHSISVSSFTLENNVENVFEHARNDSESSIRSDLPVYKDNIIPSSSVGTLSLATSSSSGGGGNGDEFLNLQESDDILSPSAKTIPILDVKSEAQSADVDSNDGSFTSAHSDINIHDLNLEEIDLDDDKHENAPTTFGCLSFDTGDNDLTKNVNKSEGKQKTEKPVTNIQVVSGDVNQNIKVVENIDVVWDTPVEEKTDNPTASRFVSFKRLRSTLTGKIKTPVDVMQKIKSAKPKQIFSDLKKDIVDQHKEVTNIKNRAVSIFKHGKPENSKEEGFTVSYKKADAGHSGEAMQLKFVTQESKCEEKTECENSGLSVQSSIRPQQSRQSLSIPNPSAEDRLSLSSETTSLLEDDLASMSRFRDLSTQFDEGEIQWGWVSAEAVNLLDESKVKHWLYKDKASVLSNLYHKQVSQASWRTFILEKLRERNLNQCKRYNNYSLAIEKAGWSKSGSMKWWQDIHRGQKWVPCTVELSQDAESAGSALTCTYTWKAKEESVYIDMKDVLCVQCEKEEGGEPPVFCIHTTDRISTQPPTQPLRLSTSREEEMEDWVSTLNGTVCELQGQQGSPTPSSVWSLTDRGEVFVHESTTGAAAQMLNNMFWHQLGGRLKLVESNCLGVTWALANTGTAYVYTGGYGGGFFKGVSSSPYGIHPMCDTQELYVYENQRWRLGSGYTDKARLVTHFMWSDEMGHKEMTKDSVKLPSCHWSWECDWGVDYRTPGGVDKEGWQYATGKSFHRKFYPHPKINSTLRRRRWARRCKITTSGPWEEVGPLPLLDISIQPDLDETGSDQNVAVWAVGQNGDMLSRAGVSKSNFKGNGWLHVSSDQVFVSVSIGTQYRVWALTDDGGVWCRQGVTSQNTTGTKWEHIEPPARCHLRQISAGRTRVCAVDKDCVLWYRSGITEECCLGLQWVKVHSNIRQVSVGPQDQIWIIRDKCESKMGTVNGVLSRRVGIPDTDPTQGTWDTGPVGGWSYVSVRGWSH